MADSDKKLISYTRFDPPSQGSQEDLAGIGKDWPSGRAVFTNEDKSFYIQINNEDHMSIVLKKENVTI